MDFFCRYVNIRYSHTTEWSWIEWICVSLSHCASPIPNFDSKQKRSQNVHVIKWGSGGINLVSIAHIFGESPVAYVNIIYTRISVLTFDNNDNHYNNNSLPSTNTIGQTHYRFLLNFKQWLLHIHVCVDNR